MFFGGRHYALAPLENHVEVYAPSLFALKQQWLINLFQSN